MTTAKPNRVEDWIPTRQSLLSRLRDWDDRDSWEDFFNTYWRFIYQMALRSGLNDAEAQEVVQETVITVAKQIPGFRYDPAKGSFKGWLLKTTQWRIGDQFRKRRKSIPLGLDPGDASETNSESAGEGEVSVGDAGSSWDTLWQENLLEVALEHVKRRADPREFQMFDLVVNRGWTVLKVAEKLNATRAHVYYARAKIARKIRREIARLEQPTP
jgi:RNA polymerase sigma-70 factor (ECF subfamily)